LKFWKSSCASKVSARSSCARVRKVTKQHLARFVSGKRMMRQDWTTSRCWGGGGWVWSAGAAYVGVENVFHRAEEVLVDGLVGDVANARRVGAALRHGQLLAGGARLARGALFAGEVGALMLRLRRGAASLCGAFGGGELHRGGCRGIRLRGLRGEGGGRGEFGRGTGRCSRACRTSCRC
jgi:hypothetical protein